MTGDERPMLTVWLDYQRATLLWKCGGVSGPDLARKGIPTSNLSLLGLLRHMTYVEWSWFQKVFSGDTGPEPFSTEEDPDVDFNDLHPDRVDDDMARFLELLPREVDGMRLRHALEVRHPSFQDRRFHDLARAHNVAIVFAESDEFPMIEEPTADFTYARLMRSAESRETGYPAAALTRWAKRARDWAKRGDVFLYFISGAKVRNPAAAQALIARLGRGA